MAFPTKPTEPLPTWATDPGAIKVDPTSTKRGEGWVYAGLGLQYGEAPPFQWVNNEAFNNGQWATYFNNVANFLFDPITGLSAYKPSLINLMQSSNLTFTAATKLTFDTVTSHNGSSSAWNSGTSTFTAPITGLYCIQSNLGVKYHNITSNSAFDIISPLRVNTSSLGIIIMAETSVSGIVSALTDIETNLGSTVYIPLTSGDTFYFDLFANSDINCSYGFNGIYSSQLSIKWNI